MSLCIRDTRRVFCILITLSVLACDADVTDPDLPEGFQVQESIASRQGVIVQWIGDLRDKNGKFAAALRLTNTSKIPVWYQVRSKKPTYANWQEESGRLGPKESQLFVWHLMGIKPRPFPIAWSVFSDPSKNNLITEKQLQYSLPLRKPLISSGQLRELQIFLMFWVGGFLPVIALFLGAGVIVFVVLLVQKGRKS